MNTNTSWEGCTIGLYDGEQLKDAVKGVDKKKALKDMAEATTQEKAFVTKNAEAQA